MKNVQSDSLNLGMYYTPKPVEPPHEVDKVKQSGHASESAPGRVIETPMRLIRYALSGACLLLSFAGCGNRVIFVPPAGVATRVGPAVTGRIYTYDADSRTWILSGGKAAYPEGAYIVTAPAGATTLPTK